MNLKPVLLEAMTALGVTPSELTTLKDRMLYSVSQHHAQLAALDTQIASLTAQRDVVVKELSAAQGTALKLVEIPKPEPVVEQPVEPAPEEPAA